MLLHYTNSATNELKYGEDYIILVLTDFEEKLKSFLA